MDGIDSGNGGPIFPGACPGSRIGGSLAAIGAIPGVGDEIGGGVWGQF